MGQAQNLCTGHVSRVDLGEGASQRQQIMSGDLELIEALIRGMAAGMALLLAATLLVRDPLNWRRALGGFFVMSVGGYVLVSSPLIEHALGPARPFFILMAIFAPIFFWWFSLALFDDRFEWRWFVFAPVVFRIAQMSIYFFGDRTSLFSSVVFFIWQIMIISMYAHIIYTAVRYVNDDLIEGRRRFRGVFAFAVGLLGLIIVFAESTGVDDTLPPELMLVHAIAISALTLGFGVWMMSARNEVLDGVRENLAVQVGKAMEPATRAAARIKAADRPAYDKLTHLMNEGVYREEGLTVRALAEKVGVPEHQLRKLINREIGYRNFSAFLNARRIADAQRALADPAQARKQVVQVALDLGYGSIAPFNRAFKEATGKTPTEFRKAAFGEE